jgi:CHAT domain-containing protein
LLRHAEITVLPSALFVERRSLDPLRVPRSGRFVLIGDPVIRENIWRRTCAPSNESRQFAHSPFDWTRSLPSLPGTRAEVLDIAELMRRSHSAASVETLLGCAATPAALRTSVADAELLHIATHGLIDARRPRLSALVLTPDSGPLDDGAVELPDILEMRLHAHLVALSACDTSSGRLLPGEGVLGLAQAFLQSGAESVVASYWRVEDQATAGFMTSFYRHLLIDRLSTTAALRRAQLDASAAGNYNWAAFAVYGQPDVRL